MSLCSKLNLGHFLEKSGVCFGCAKIGGFIWVKWGGSFRECHTVMIMGLLGMHFTGISFLWKRNGPGPSCTVFNDGSVKLKGSYLSDPTHLYHLPPYV